MTQNQISRWTFAWVVALACLLNTHQATAQGTTAFTYQGQLRDGGTNANGTYTMTFKLYDAVSGGGQIGSTVTTTPTLANGLFTVNLDFGATAFTGNARWLEITAQNGTNASETLAPRVQVLATPYALYAAVAATVTNGAIMNAQLATNAVLTTNIQNSAVTAAKIASGQVVKSLNGLTDAVTLSAGGNAALTASGNNLLFSVQIPKIQVFTTSGTFVVPTNGVTKVMVEMWGGGGGGGSHGYYTVGGITNGNPGGGGGAGAYAFNRLTVTPGASYTVTVGNGGAGASFSNNYAAELGGTTSFDVLMSAGGGGGGGNGLVGGNISAPGQGGGPGGFVNNSAAIFGGGNGENGEDIRGGRGGSAVRGGNGGWESSPGETPGGGGGGRTDGSHAAGDGGKGSVIIYF